MHGALWAVIWPNRRMDLRWPHEPYLSSPRVSLSVTSSVCKQSELMPLEFEIHWIDLCDDFEIAFEIASTFSQLRQLIFFLD